MTSARKNDGVDTESSEKTMMTLSVSLFCLTADRTPNVMPTTAAKTVAPSASFSVAG